MYRHWVGSTLLIVMWWPAGLRGEGLDWGAWQGLPVYYNGRVMPLDTLARDTVETICGSQRPQLIGQAGRRRYEAAELVFGWLADTEHWEDELFLPAEHEALRELLGVSLRDGEGNRIRRVSPREVMKAERFWRRVDEISRRVQDDSLAGNEADELDRKVQQLYKAYSTYRELLLDGRADARVRARFGEACRRVEGAWREVVLRVADLPALDEETRWQGELLRVDHEARQLIEIERETVELAQWDHVIEMCAIGVDQLRDRHAELGSRADKGLDDLLMAMRERLGQARATLYDNEKLLRVVPALNVAALDKDRLPENGSQPWIDLQTLLNAPPEMLSDYPGEELRGVVLAFGKARKVYAHGREVRTDFERALGELSTALRSLAAASEPVRRRLIADASVDEALLAYTSYPTVEGLRSELRYNRLAPFGWSWWCYAAALGCGLITYRPIRLAALVASVGCLVGGMAWSVFGFALRMSITGWAPVTNMYETVIYVPLIVTMLGLGMLASPVTLPSWLEAWGQTSWGRVRRSPGLDRAWWNTLVLMMRLGLSVAVFWALCIAPYGAGGRAVLTLVPRWSAGSAVGFLDAGVTWLVSLVVAAGTTWYGPRFAVSLGMAAALVLRAVCRMGRSEWEALYERRIYLTATAGAASLGAFVAWYAPVLDRSFSPLQPILRDNFWLLVHVLTIVSSYGAGALAWALGNVALAMYLVGRYPSRMDGNARWRGPRDAGALSAAIYKSIQVAVVLLATGTVLGGLWADVAWGRFWGWDPKEVWALVTLLVYLAILHGRYAGWVGHFGLAAGTVLGASAILMSWYGVNFVLGVGLHSYGFGSGGQAEVLGVVVINWLFVGASGLRYGWINRTIRQAEPEHLRAPHFRTSTGGRITRAGEKNCGSLRE